MNFCIICGYPLGQKKSCPRCNTPKPSLLDQIRNKVNEEGICETCGNLEQITENAIGCTLLDKLILPEFPPYHGNCKCYNWKKRSEA